MDYWVVRSAGALAIRGTIAVLLGILALGMRGLLLWSWQSRLIYPDRRYFCPACDIRSSDPPQPRLACA